jgi:hypothetical protein
MLQALEDTGKTLHEFIAEVPQYITLRENLTCKNEQKIPIVANLQKTLPQPSPITLTSQMWTASAWRSRVGGFWFGRRAQSR